MLPIDIKWELLDFNVKYFRETGNPLIKKLKKSIYYRIDDEFYFIIDTLTMCKSIAYFKLALYNLSEWAKKHEIEIITYGFSSVKGYYPNSRWYKTI